MKLLNPDQYPNSPKSWSCPKATLHWPPQVPLSAFYDIVVKFCTNNGIAVPTQDEVEHQICQQIPKRWCGDRRGTVQRSTTTTAAPVKRSGCSTCGQRKNKP